jgi:hypothetical protein
VPCTEGLISEKVQQLRIFKRLSEAICARLLSGYRNTIPQLILPPIAAVSKTFFFDDTFSILM